MSPDQNKEKNPSLKGKEKLKDTSPPSLSPAQPSEQTSDDKKIDQVLDESSPFDEAHQLMEELKYKQKIIKQELESLYEQRNISPTYLHQYVNNPSNFSGEEWQNLQQQRQEFIDSLEIPPKLLEKIFQSKQLGPIVEENSPQLKKQNRIGGAHRRGWLPMR